MRLARFAVYHPIFTIMATLIVIILGGLALVRLPVDLMPDITSPTLSVTTTYENAGPEEIEELVTRPIEEAMSAVPGVEEVTSISREGMSNVRLTFTWGTNLDAASNDVRDRLDRVMARLPDDADRPTLFKFDLASFPILILGASSRLDPVQVRQIIEDQVKYRIERLPGVAALDIWGGLAREIHVNLSWDRIKALGLPLDQVLSRIQASNVDIPAGRIDRANYEVTIRTPGQFTSLDELRDTVIAVREGVNIRLKEVADIDDSWQRVRQIVRVNGEPGIRLSVTKQSGTNTVEVARRALAEIEQVNEDIPQIRLTPIIDTSDYIKRSITNVGGSAMNGGALAIFILLFFLRNVRSTLVIATAIPISIIATFALLYFSGFNLNLMTLGGLALGVGMLVDNAIVVLENIYRLREEGQSPEQAAINGTEEVTAAIVSSTVTTLVVFLPLVFVRGMSGVMFKQMSIVISFSLMCSLLAALTLVPMLAVHLLRRGAVHAETGNLLRRLVLHSAGWCLGRLEDAYRDLLRLAMAHRALVFLVTVLAMGGSLALGPLIGVELMPASDEGEVRVNAEMEVGTRLDLFDRQFRKIEEIVRASVPEAKSTVASIGASRWGRGGVHAGDLRIGLKPQAERTRSSEDIAADLRKKLVNIPGVVIRTRAGQGLFILRMATAGSDKIEVDVRGFDFHAADALARQVKEAVSQVPGVTDVTVSRESGGPEELIHVDREKAADMKLTVSQIAGMLETIISGTPASNYREAGDEYRILVKLKDAEQRQLRDILDLTLTNADGQPVVLRNVIRVESRKGPVLIERRNQERIILVSANYAERDMGAIIADIREGLRSIPRPRDFALVMGGDYEEQQKAFQELLLSFGLALILVYMVMACQYESLVDPFVVMFSVPLAAVGVILMLFLTDTTFNIQSFIGCIMLGGIVVNNAILLVDHTSLLRQRDGMPMREAIAEAGRRRLRPILMTALTTILGLVPLALGWGEGGESQAPLARAVLGGLISSTLITLVFVPVMYSLLEWARRRRPQPLPAVQAQPDASTVPGRET